MFLRSVMKHKFSNIPHADIPRSNFNRSHAYKTTFDSGYLIPFYIDEVLPGDTFNLQATVFARLATPIVPIMDNLFLDTFYFFVPLRLVWDNFQKFNGEQDNPGDSTDYLVPQINSPPNGWQVGSLSDYFGLPTDVGPLSVAAFWHRAYNLIYNEWFRDQNLQDSVPVPKGDGPDNDADFKLLRRGKRHDYFTSALPWPQKGPGIELPIGGTAPVYGNGKTLGLYDGVANFGLEYRVLPQFRPGTSDPYYLPYDDGSGEYRATPLPRWAMLAPNAAAYNQTPSRGPDNPAPAPPIGGQIGRYGVVPKGYESGLYADLSQAAAVTINTFRQAFQIQRLLERDARGGTRYTEIVRSHFGVVSPDARLQRPEYLGGGSSPVLINPVQQTSSTDTTTPQGNLAAFGLVSGNNGFVQSFTEHGLIVGLVNVRADLTYQQGIDRMFSRRTRWDFYWPAFAHLGEQAILNKEIYAQGSNVIDPATLQPVDDSVFGYQERFAEYRYSTSRITGKFRSTYAQSLDVWHLSQKFDNLPALSSQWIEDKPPIDRVIAVPSEPQFIFDSMISLNCARPMPVYSTPGLVDHF